MAIAVAVLAVGVAPASAQAERTPLAARDRPPADVRGEVAEAEREVVVGLTADCDRARFEAELARQGATILGEIPRLRALRVGFELGSPRDVAEACAALGALAGVEYAEPNGAAP
ncbi:MAG TPA: hypothetical protein VFD43_05820, partial [Planctomycetota bacterium]|nr:hypothetical protein [Planctomycetota bacterium]